MAHWFEHQALRKLIAPGEQILSSDLLDRFEAYSADGQHNQAVYADLAGRRGVRRAEVVVVTDQRVYVKDQSGGIVYALFSDLAGVGRLSPPNHYPPQVQLIFQDRSCWILSYGRRSSDQRSADEITLRFFGRVIKDTIHEFGGGTKIDEGRSE